MVPVQRQSRLPGKDMRTGYMRIFLVFLAVLAAITGCVDPGGRRTVVPVENAANAGRLYLFLNLRSADGPPVAMTVSAVELLAGDGGWETKSLGSLVVDAAQIRAGQKFLTRMVLPPGTYRKLRLVLGGAERSRASGRVAMALRDSLVELPLRNALQVRAGDSKSLFLTWDTAESVKNGVFFPILQLRPSLKKLIADAAYVACPDIDTVFMLNTDSNRVIDSLGIPGRPAYILQSRLYEKDKVFVLTGSEIIAFSPATNEIVERNSLTMLRKPVHMTFGRDGRWAYILDRQRSSVSRLDLGSGTIDAQARLEYAPDFILYLEKPDLLAVTLGRGQTVVLLSPDTLATVGSVSTGMRPAGLMDWNGRYLFIAETGTNSVMVYDYENNAMLKRIPVGFQPARLAGSATSVYVANRGSGSISVVHPGLLDVTRSIPVIGIPAELTYVSRNRWMYAGNEDSMAVDVIESTTGEVVTSIELGAVPGGFVVLR